MPSQRDKAKRWQFSLLEFLLLTVAFGIIVSIAGPVVVNRLRRISKRVEQQPVSTPIRPQNASTYNPARWTLKKNGDTAKLDLSFDPEPFKTDIPAQ